MDPEFKRVVLVVMVAGTIVGGIGATALYFVFRAFGGKKAGDSSHFGLIAALIAFVFACCVLLFLLSYAGR